MLARLTAALKEAEIAHAEYEKTLGHRDDNWAAWYANNIMLNYPILVGRKFGSQSIPIEEVTSPAFK